MIGKIDNSNSVNVFQVFLISVLKYFNILKIIILLPEIIEWLLCQLISLIDNEHFSLHIFPQTGLISLAFMHFYLFAVKYDWPIMK